MNSNSCDTHIINFCTYICRRIIFRGDEEDDATLCVGDDTFDVRIAETSNTLLLSPDCKWPQQDPGTISCTSCGIVAVIRSLYHVDYTHIEPSIINYNVVYWNTCSLSYNCITVTIVHILNDD